MVAPEVVIMEPYNATNDDKKLALWQLLVFSDLFVVCVSKKRFVFTSLYCNLFHILGLAIKMPGYKKPSEGHWLNMDFTRKYRSGV